MTEERKPRSPSEFVLFKLEHGEEGVPVYEPLDVGATNNELIEKAKTLGVGQYEIHYVRRKFTVATKTETVIE